MGDPRKARKTYSTPGHPWNGPRIEEENKVRSEYGLKTKKEIWKAESKLRNFRAQARSLVGLEESSSDIKTKQLLSKLIKLGILDTSATLDDVLALELKDILNRRLQTIVNQKDISYTTKDARQLILHGHITINGEKHTAPSELILKEDEDKIAYIGPKRVAGKPTKPKKSEDDDIQVDEIGKPAEKKGEKTEGKPAESKPEEKKEESKEEKK